MSLHTVVYTDGALKKDDILNQCKNERWVPLMVTRRKGDQGPPTLIAFNDPYVLRKFIARNMPKGWTIATCILNGPDIEEVKRLGWGIEIYTFPKKIMQHPEIDVGYEVLNLVAPPSAHKSSVELFGLNCRPKFGTMGVKATWDKKAGE